MSQNTFDYKATLAQLIWLGAVRQQAITWANVEPDRRRHVFLTMC